MTESPYNRLFPTFLKLVGRPVLLVGGGRVALAKQASLREAGARVTVVAPAIDPGLRRPDITCLERPFLPSDLEGVWFVVAAATPAVNRAVAEAAEAHRVFVNAVDDPAVASAYSAGVVRRGGVTVAISTDGEAPALAGLLREGLEALLPAELERWTETARAIRPSWRQDGVPMEARRPLLLQALVRLYPAAVGAVPAPRPGTPR